MEVLLKVISHELITREQSSGLILSVVVKGPRYGMFTKHLRCQDKGWGAGFRLSLLVLALAYPKRNGRS